MAYSPFGKKYLLASNTLGLNTKRFAKNKNIFRVNVLASLSLQYTIFKRGVHSFFLKSAQIEQLEYFLLNLKYSYKRRV